MTSKGWMALIAGALLAVPLLSGAAFAEEAAIEAVEAEEVAVEVEEMKGSVARGVFTTSVVDREPQDELMSLPSDHEMVYFFSELKDLAGQTVTHRWEYNGQVMAEVSFDVGGDRWRIHSSKNLQPSWLGEWTVTIVDANENVFSTHKLDYKAAAQVEPDAPVAQAAVATETEPVAQAEPAAQAEPTAQAESTEQAEPTAQVEPTEQAVPAAPAE